MMQELHGNGAGANSGDGQVVSAGCRALGVRGRAG